MLHFFLVKMYFLKYYIQKILKDFLLGKGCNIIWLEWNFYALNWKLVNWKIFSKLMIYIILSKQLLKNELLFQLKNILDTIGTENNKDPILLEVPKYVFNS